MELKIETYIPFRDEDKTIKDFSERLIKELLNHSSDIKIPLDDFGSANIEIQIVDKQKLKDLVLNYPAYFKSNDSKILHFCSNINFELIYDFSKQLREIPKEEINRGLLAEIYIKRFINFIYFTQLAIPGSLNTNKGLILKDGIYFRDFERMDSCLIGIAYDDNIEWPFVKFIKITTVWEYILNKTNILENQSINNIENGLNAFTHLFNNSNESVYNLFWAMSGIEALYAEGEIGIGYQIDSKAKLFLGEPNENKKVLKKLYSFRSKFLHGSMSIPINSGWIPKNEVDEYHNDFYQMEYLATRLLTSTLQKIVDKNMNSFKFEFKLSE